jgi:hypothetical protein
LKKQLVEAGASKEDTVVVTKHELEQLKGLIAAGYADRNNATTKAVEKQRMQELAKSKKGQIQAIDEERFQKGLLHSNEEKETDFLRFDEQRRSKRMQDEDRDEVKGLNSLSLYSKCATVHDFQIEEKKQIAAQRVAQEKRLDTMMEMERLKALKMYEEREIKRVEDRRKGAAVIKAQMEERETERLRQLELKHQEQEAMLRHIEKMKADDRRAAEKKKEREKLMMQDVALANAEQIRLKTRQRETEVEEDRRIAVYIKEKERREQELVEEQERLRHEREMEVARLRSLQEKAQDKQAEQDALRAKRAQELYEREWRAKEKAEQERVARIEKGLAEARLVQQREKEAIQHENAIIEAEEYDRIVAAQILADRAAKEVRDAEKAKRVAHQKELKEQMHSIQEVKKHERRQFMEEGKTLRKDKEDFDRYMEYVRENKVKELGDQGVPAKYRTVMQKKRTGERLLPAR